MKRYKKLWKGHEHLCSHEMPPLTSVYEICSQMANWNFSHQKRYLKKCPDCCHTFVGNFISSIIISFFQGLTSESSVDETRLWLQNNRFQNYLNMFANYTGW